MRTNNVVGQLWFDTVEEEGSVRFNDRFLELPRAYQLDALKDWLSLLEAEYERMLEGPDVAPKRALSAEGAR